MIRQAEVRNAHIDVTKLSKVVARTSREQFRARSKVGQYFLSIYEKHEAERTQENWMEILVLLQRLLDFVQEHLIDATGKFKLYVWKVFTLYSFMRNWLRDFLTAIRKKNP